MASSINASTSGAGGVITTADASGVLNVQTAGTTALSISASQVSAFSGNLSTLGSLGVGTATPAEQFQVQGTVNSGNVRGRIQNSSATSSSADLIINAGTNNSYIQLISAYNSNGAITFGSSLTYGFINTAGAVPLLFGTSGTEKMRLLDSGTFCVGTTGVINVAVAGNYGLSVSNTEVVIAKNTASCALYVKNASSAGSVAMIFYNGEVQAGYIVTTNTSTTTYNSGSDYRLKESVQPLTNALSTVAKLKPSTYKWKVDGSEGQGFIAHELQEVFPLAVTGEKDAVDEDGKPKLQGVDQSKLVVLLTAALQELNAKVDAQAAEIAALKAGA
jgi:hypothetical protein